MLAGPFALRSLVHRPAQAARVPLRRETRAPARQGHAKRQKKVRAVSAAKARAAARVARPAAWDVRLFSVAFAIIVAVFVIALLYVSQATSLSVAGYEVQRLAAARDELRRQNGLLEVQQSRLDSPVRITADATRMGMIRASFVPVLTADPLTARR